MASQKRKRIERVKGNKFMNGFNNGIMRFKHALDIVLGWSLIVILVALVLTVIWQVASRYLLQTPSTVTDEVARFLLIWLSLLGAAYAVGQNKHLSVDLLKTSLEPYYASVLACIITTIIAVFSILVLIVGGSSLVSVTLFLDQRSTVLQIPFGYVYGVLPLSGVIILVYCLFDLNRHFVRLKTGTAE